MTTKIPLTQGKFALIDTEDLNMVNQFKWYAAKDGRYNRWYVCHNVGSGNGNQRQIRLHRFILDAPRGTQIDHINGDALDNRRVNLRFCTHKQNLQNQFSTRGTSKYKGVYKRNGKYESYIRVNGRLSYLGLFACEKDAANAYDVAALEHFGEFARLNKGE